MTYSLLQPTAVRGAQPTQSQAAALLEVLEQDEKDGKIVHRWESDSKGLSRVVWMDTNHLSRYEAYARDLIVMDTTYKVVNFGDMKLHAIVYPNEQGNTETLMWGLSRTETIADYTFIFNSLAHLVRPHVSDPSLVAPAVSHGMCYGIGA